VKLAEMEGQMELSVQGGEETDKLSRDWLLMLHQAAQFAVSLYCAQSQFIKHTESALALYSWA
jgi:hypothetical protein